MQKLILGQSGHRFLSVCVCVCDVCMHVCKGQRMTSKVIPQMLFILFLGERVSHWPQSHGAG